MTFLKKQHFCIGNNTLINSKLKQIWCSKKIRLTFCIHIFEFESKRIPNSRSPPLTYYVHKKCALPFFFFFPPSKVLSHSSPTQPIRCPSSMVTRVREILAETKARLTLELAQRTQNRLASLVFFEIVFCLVLSSVLSCLLSCLVF